MINVLSPRHEEVGILIIFGDGLVGDLNDLSRHLPDLRERPACHVGWESAETEDQGGLAGQVLSQDGEPAGRGARS